MSGWTHEAVRVGDRERRQALKALAKHHARGRIDDAEHAERADAIGTARTLGDLHTVLADLGRGPRQAAYDAWQRPVYRRRAGFPLLPLLVVLAIVLAATGTVPWFAVAIAAGVLLLLAPWRRRAGSYWAGAHGAGARGAGARGAGARGAGARGAC